jgi:hypothetical protein
VLLILCAAACAAVAAPSALAYGWPLKPFDRQHAVRGYFDDPRISGETDGGLSEAFHFGIDISAPDYTPVYSVAAGRAFVRGNTLRVRFSVGGVTREFSYWHVYPSVYSGDRIRLHQLVGHTVPGYLHVHFSESIGHVYVNPLRAGALRPYSDTTKPVVAAVSFVSGDRGTAENPKTVAGAVDLTTTAYDVPPVAPPAPWSVVRLAPALIRWRILGLGGNAVTQWRTAVDFRWSLLPQPLFNLIYAPGTKQNKANRPGNYVFYLAHGWDSTTLPNGAYGLAVEALDTRGNRGSALAPFVIAN